MNKEVCTCKSCLAKLEIGYNEGTKWFGDKEDVNCPRCGENNGSIRSAGRVVVRIIRPPTQADVVREILGL